MIPVFKLLTPKTTKALLKSRIKPSPLPRLLELVLNLARVERAWPGKEAAAVVLNWELPA
jgi:hypothetical protein